MAETLVIDPTTEAAGNVPLTLTSDPYGLLEHHYPQPPIDSQWASTVSTEGAVLASNRYQNREISITVDVNTLAGARTLQAKLAKLHREALITGIGGTLQRTMSDGTVITFDILAVDGYDPTFDQTWHLGGITQTAFTLTCKPFGRGAEILLTAHTESTLPVLRFVQTGIKGDVPATAKLFITTPGQQAWAVWGMRSRYYDSASTAALFIEAEAMSLGTSAALSAGTPSGSTGGSSVAMTISSGATNHNALNYTATHVGTYRVLARVQDKSTNVGTSSVQLGWFNQGEGRTTNAVKKLNATQKGNWQVVDLGQITARPDPLGGLNSWTLDVAAFSTAVTNDTIYFDHLIFIPVDEGSGQSVSITSLRQYPTTASGRNFVVSSKGAFSESALTAGRYGAAPNYSGDYLLVPPAGAENRSVEFIVRLVVGGNDANGVSGYAAFDDGVLDFVFSNTTAQLLYIPRYLAIPSS